MMDTHQIDHALRHVPFFRGTFASNQLPYVYMLDPPFALVVNTAPSAEEGDHWVAYYSDDRNQLEYFDSLGKPPLTAVRCQYNVRRIQGACSSVCGEYCIYFLHSRAVKNVSLEEFINSFSEKNLEKNDKLVYRIVHHEFYILPRTRPYPAFLPKTLGRILNSEAIASKQCLRILASFGIPKSNSFGPTSPKQRLPNQETKHPDRVRYPK